MDARGRVPLVRPEWLSAIATPLLLFGLLAGSARAEVYVERMLKIGLLNAENRGVLFREWILPDRMRYETERIFKEQVPGGDTGGETAQILRFDTDTQWILDRPGSLYVEMPLSELIATLPWIQAAGQPMAGAVTEGKPSWSAKTDKTGERETIAGLDTRMSVLKIDGVQETPEGKIQYRIRDYVWLTEELPSQADVDTFRAKLRTSIGTDISFLPIAVGLYERFPNATRILMDERAAMAGYPMRDSLTLHVSSPGKKFADDDGSLIPLFILSVTKARVQAESPGLYELPPDFRKKENE